MCIFTWNRWACGHFRTTSIEYCDEARNMCAKLRTYITDCHVPSEAADLNRHQSHPCRHCAYNEEARHRCRWLPYIALADEKKDKPVTPIQQQYAETARELAKMRRSQRRAEAELRTLRWDRIHNLTQQLFNFEERYRSLGGQYYKSGWFMSLEEGNDSEYAVPDLIVNALHGQEKNRAFFQPWWDLEKSVALAVRLVKTAKLDEALHELENGTRFARDVKESLDELERLVNIANNSYDAIGRPEDYQARDRAV
ncbi:hypothetical protein K491DRAFT_711890 [Lophiostoma macrostomum CBS 122681]|uniref:Uncharacterized protein n=1 Tax=Lophiostoma macrostomum CBS 122681 TaxID=1314788 RepID=A0A6A6TM45_9PLEO|nr:hypothetical protein K491DRAFT_711890 [Lophiostoma macrostomum CBS 122681]